MGSQILTPALVALDVDLGANATEVISALAGIAQQAGRATTSAELELPALERESRAGTGVPGGAAIPHCRTAAVTEPTVVFARLHQGVDFGGPDGRADLIFLIAVPVDGGKLHLKILSKLARALLRPEFLAALRAAPDAPAVVDLVREVVDIAPPSSANTAPAPTAAGSSTSASTTQIIAITACPTGIAHTYLAADALRHATQRRSDVELRVETQGAAADEQLDPATISAATAVIFATDIGIRDRDRFLGKPVIESGVRQAINEPDALIEQALAAAQDPQARRVTATSTPPAAHSPEPSQESSQRFPQALQTSLMTGMSYLLPFLTAAGLLLALGYWCGGDDIASGWMTISREYSLTHLPGHDIVVAGVTKTFARSGLLLYVGAVCFAIGQAALQLLVPALSGYIAWGLAGRPGIAPGFIGGFVAETLGTGCLGGIISGLVAGGLAAWLAQWGQQRHLPRWLGSLLPTVFIPLFATLVTGLAMYLFLGAALMAMITSWQLWIASLPGAVVVLLSILVGIILGAMMCYDCGGPVNKAAYFFATVGITSGDPASWRVMAAVMAAGMVPPLALAVAMSLRRSLFTPAEREQGKSLWLLGLSFISEGAIPCAAADPRRVIPALLAGGAVTGALSMALDVSTRVPHGGIFVIFAIAPAGGFVLALLAGVAVSASGIIILKQFWRTPTPGRAQARTLGSN